MDIQYLLFLQSLREAAPMWLNQVLYFISELAVNGVLTLVILLIYWCIDKKAGLYLLFCQMGATLVNQLVKNTACIYRPWIRDPSLHVANEAAATATGYSFPSGHTTNAMANYGGIAFWQRKHKLIAVLLVSMALITGFARNWLGAHTPQDVAVALTLSTLFVLLAAKGFSWMEKHPGKENIIFAVGLCIIAAALLYTELKPYPIDYAADGTLLVDPHKMKTDCFKAYGMMCGLLLGWFAELKLIHFDVSGSKVMRALRFVLGAVCTVLIQKFCVSPAITLLGTNWGTFTIYLFMILFAVAIYPAIFTAIKNHSSKSAPIQKQS